MPGDGVNLPDCYARPPGGVHGTEGSTRRAGASPSVLVPRPATFALNGPLKDSCAFRCGSRRGAGAPYFGPAGSDAGGVSLRSGGRSWLVLGRLAALGPLGVFLGDQPLD